MAFVLVHMPVWELTKAAIEREAAAGIYSRNGAVIERGDLYRFAIPDPAPVPRLHRDC